MEQIKLQVDAAIEACAKAVKQLETNPSKTTAEESCLACREAVQIFFLAYGDFGSSAASNPQTLVESLERAENELKVLAANNPSSPLLSAYLDNVRRRRKLVDALIQSNIPLIKEILQESLS